jgi:polar amino acid transport system substrate-binding protein
MKRVVAVSLLLIVACAFVFAAPAAPVEVKFNQALHDLLPAELQKTGVLKVATSAGSPPYTLYAEDNKTITGGDIDLAIAIGQVLGLKVEFTSLAFPGIIPAILAGRFDMSIASMGDTPAREKQINFVNYSVEGNAVVVKEGNPKNIKNLEGLDGRSVAVLRGSVMQGLVEQQVQKGAKIDIQVYPNQNEANLAVRSGRADATLSMAGTSNYYVKHNQDTGLTVLLDTLYGAGYNAIGVSKNNPALLLCIEQAMQRLMASGAYLQILSKWGLEGGAITVPWVNDGAKYAQPTG